MATLDEIRAAADAKYGAYSIDDVLVNGKPVQLTNALRLPKKTRDKVLGLQKTMKEDGVDQAELLKEALLLIAATPAQGKALLNAIGDDLAVLAETFYGWAKGTQAGEA